MRRGEREREGGVLTWGPDAVRNALLLRPLVPGDPWDDGEEEQSLLDRSLRYLPSYKYTRMSANVNSLEMEMTRRKTGMQQIMLTTV